MAEDEQAAATDLTGVGRPAITRAMLLAGAVVAVPAIVVLCVLFAVLPGPWWIGIPIGVAVAAVLVLLRRRSADHQVLRAVGPAVLQADGGVRLENLVQGLSLAGGVAEPTVVVLSDDARNAMAVRNLDRNHLVITQGLLSSLEVVELEGVVAELLTRLRSGDAEAATVGAALFGQPLLDGPLRPLLAPVAKLGLRNLLAEDRDLEADRQAVSLTRYPPGLLSAFRTVAAGDVSPAAASDGLAHLWLVDPTPAEARHEDRASLDLRIDVLAEL